MLVVATHQAMGFGAELCGGQCLHETVTYETGEEVGLDRVDVVFLLDVSGSMGDELNTVQEQSIEIMNDLRALVADSAFGAASFVDYNGFIDSEYGEEYASDDDYPYRLEQDITENLNAVRNTLNNITLEYGADWPEAYSRALWEMQFLSWRENSKRIVILFGDAIPHDRTFFGEDYGVDPGRDELEGTADDLVFEDIVQQLIDARITVIGVNSDHESSEVVVFFEYVSEQTGGQYFPLSDADEIPGAVVRLVEEEISTIDWLTVRSSEDFEDWIVSTPEAHTDVGPGTSVSFEVEICPVAGRAKEGRYDFDLIVDGDGVELEAIPVSIDYTPRCTSGAEIYVGDHPDDDGSVCSNRNGEPHWLSDNIVVRHEDDGIYYHQNPIRGDTNYIYAQVHNIGDEDATRVSVDLYWGNAAIGLWWPDHWDKIGSTRIDVPAGESVWTEAILWDPPGARGEGHFCLFARIESDEDPITREGDVPCDNNIAQRNLQVLDLEPDEPGESSSSEDASFTIIAPPEDLMGVIDIVVILPDVPDGTEVWISLPSDLFERWLDAGGELEGGEIDDDQIIADPNEKETVLHNVPLEPGEESKVEMHIEAPVSEETEGFSVTVIERVDGQDVGGNTYYYVPPEPPPAAEILDYIRDNLVIVGGLLCCGGVFAAVIAVGAVLIVLRRNRSQVSPPPATLSRNICPQCGTPLRDRATFCTRCGSRVEGAAPPAPAAGHLCPNCGAGVRQGAKFCPKCGTGLR